MEIQFLPICIASLVMLSIFWFFKRKSRAIYCWPVVGTLPSLLWNSNRQLEWMTEVFSSLGGTGSFVIDGGLISKLSYIVTCHPQNLEYILKTNFSNFPKGSDFKEIFEILGDGIFGADNNSWRLQRKLAQARFASAEFRDLVSKTSRRVVEDRLVLLLSQVAKQGSVIDLQDVCKRLAYDIALITILGREVNSLPLDLREDGTTKVMDSAQEALSYRLAMPMFLWKLLRWLRVGKEKKLANAWKTVDMLLGDCISLTRKNLLKGIQTSDLLSSYVKYAEEFSKDDKFLRDTLLNIFIGGRDTMASSLIWLLWLVAKTPRVEAKIVEELKLMIMKKNENKVEGGVRTKRPQIFDSDDLKELVYLHVAICESLRMYPPVPLNSKAVIKEDVLPDGTVVKPGQQILLAIFCEGKMPWIWGVDSLEFKPERWIDEEGKLSHEPLQKFFAFNAGPRSCLGKNISFTQLKVIVAAILFNFHIELVEGLPVAPKPSISLLMKNGLLVKVQERDD